MTISKEAADVAGKNEVTDADLLRICQSFNPGQDLDLAKAVRAAVIEANRVRAESIPVAGYVSAAALEAGSDYPEWRAEFFRTAEGLLEYFPTAEPVAVFTAPRACEAARNAVIEECARVADRMPAAAICAKAEWRHVEAAADEIAAAIRALKWPLADKGQGPGRAVTSLIEPRSRAGVGDADTAAAIVKEATRRNGKALISLESAAAIAQADLSSGTTFCELQGALESRESPLVALPTPPGAHTDQQRPSKAHEGSESVPDVYEAVEGSDPALQGRHR